MRTDLIGGEDVLAKVESLREQHEQALADRDAATEAFKQAQRDDVTAGAEALRDGRAQPKPKAPEAERALRDATRHLEIVALALRSEREAFNVDIAQRSDGIRAALARAEDEADEAILEHAAEIEHLLHERAEVKAHVLWLDDTSRHIGNAPVVGLEALTALRTQLGKEPGTATSRQQEKADHERRVDEWNALVQRASQTLDRTKMSGTREYRDREVDEAIEREVERMTEAGEQIPTPPNAKWLQKLGLGAKPKGKGTGWAALPRQEVVLYPPDTESGEARSRDLARTPPAAAVQS